MNEIIKIKYDNTVSARELHNFLEVKTHLSTWIKRMCEYGFHENIDFSILKSGNRNGGVDIIDDFVLTLDMAKEISMLQRSEKGKQARRYFINCEKKLKEVVKKPLSTLEQLDMHYLVLKEQNKEINEVKSDVINVKADVTYLKNSLPLFVEDCNELKRKVNSKCCEVLKGYKTPAYNNKSIRTKVYSDIYGQVKREFGVSRSSSIKHIYIDKALEIVANYEPPTCLVNEIYNENNQIPFGDLGQVSYL